MTRNRIVSIICLILALITMLSGCGAPIGPNNAGNSISAILSQSDPVSASDPVPEEDESLSKPEYEPGSTPFSRHGALSVKGANLIDSNGEKYQLYGMSTHGIAWFPKFVNYEAFLTLRDEWNANCVRLSMYTVESGGYCAAGNREGLKEIIRNGIDYTAELGMYVIVDWHILRDENPLKYKEDAVEFFDEMSSLYAESEHILYEICSEPNGSTTWDDICQYANEVIPVIRANDPNAVIIVGTPNWSQDIDKALESPLEYDNIMYALHFYAGTHKYWLRSKLEDCLAGELPVFISEFGTCDSTGQGEVDVTQSEAWKKMIDQYNLSYIAWNLANKNETCSAIHYSCKETSHWTDDQLTQHGLLVKSWFLGEPNQ